jgi:hypothetical protein
MMNNSTHNKSPESMPATDRPVDDRRQAAQAFMDSLDLLDETFGDDEGIEKLAPSPDNQPPDGDVMPLPTDGAIVEGLPSPALR